MKTMKILAVMSLAVVITACCSCRRGKSSVTLSGTEWHLTQLYGAGITSDNYRITLGTDGTISGIGDCNRFSGTFTQGPGDSKSGGVIEIADNLVSTRMMCLGQAQEDKFLGMLRNADGYDIDGRRLLLLNGGDVLAIFEVAAPVTEPAAEPKPEPAAAN